MAGVGAIAVGLFPHAALAASAGDPFYGLYTEAAHYDEGSRNELLDAYATAGAGLVRQPFDWSRVERLPGWVDLKYYDGFVAAAAARGFDVLPTLIGAPPWANSAPERGAERGLYPPRRPAAFAEFARAMVRRYGRGGSFWVAHPEVPYRPLTSWQVWNEPNIPFFWPSGPDAAEYARLLVVTSAAVKSVDPSAEVVTAGIPDSSLGIRLQPYLLGLYIAGAQESYDTLAVHPYAHDAESVVELVESTRSTQRRYGDESRLWATEFGWASGGKPSPWTTTEAGQAEQISTALRVLSDRGAELGLRGLVYFGWQDAASADPDQQEWMGRTGLLRIDGTRKPAYPAYRTAAVRDVATGQTGVSAQVGTRAPDRDSEPRPSEGQRQALRRFAVSFGVRGVVARDGSAYVRIRCRSLAGRCHGTLRVVALSRRAGCRSRASGKAGFVAFAPRVRSIRVRLRGDTFRCGARRHGSDFRVRLSARDESGQHFVRSRTVRLRSSR